MTRHLWRLPWKSHDVPHALLDILRGCNISCTACYNSHPPVTKPLDVVCRELDFLADRRSLDSISIVGGEPTLHPQLCEIVREIKSRGISVELFTNGVLLDSSLLADLKTAGIDLIFLHIDARQQRPDLPPQATREQLQHAWTEKLKAIADAGIEAGLSITAYPDALEEVDDAVRFILESPDADYLLATLCRDSSMIRSVVGSLDEGMRADPPGITAIEREDNLTNRVMLIRLRDTFGLSPFAFLGSNIDPNDMRWLSYLIGSVVRRDGTTRWSALRPSAAERLFVRLHKRLSGRYPFFVKRSPGRFRVQLLLSALTGGFFRQNLAMLARSLRRGNSLHCKRILFQLPADVLDDGRIVHCENCPDAVVRDGRLVPVCISDQME